MPVVKTGDGIDINYIDSGPDHRRALIFSNSLGTNLHMWDEQAVALAGSHRIIRYDQRGHGISQAPAGDYSMVRLAQDVIDLMDALDLNKSDYCGLSMGGMTGLWLGANYPQRFGKMVLANMLDHSDLGDVWNGRIATVQDSGMNAIIETVVERWFTDTFRRENPNVIERVVNMLKTTNPDGYVGCVAAVRDLDFRAEVSRFQVPVLILSGSHDAATPPERGRAVAEAIDGALYIEMATAHLSNLESPKDFNIALSDFLSD